MTAKDGFAIDSKSSVFWRYGVATLIIALDLVFRYTLNPALGPHAIYALSPIAILLAARFGGRLPGLTAAAVSVLGTWFILIEPRYKSAISNPADAIGLALFAISAVCVSLLGSQLRTSLLLKVQSEQAAKQSESTVRALLNTSAQAIFAVDPDGHIVMTNRMTETMFGYSGDELPGQSLDLLVPDGTRNRHREYQTAYFGNPQRRPMGVGLLVEARRKDGTRFPAEVYLSHIETEGGGLAIAFVTDVTDRKRAEDVIRRSQTELRALAGQLITAKEEENRRLARELHDVFSQRLAMLGMEVSAMQQGTPLSSDSIVERLKLFGEKIETLVNDVHQLSRQLHPSILDDLGLIAALRAECSAFSQQHGVSAKFLPTNVPDSLPRDISLSLYRIAQQSLWNVAKHAQAREVQMSMSQVDGELILTVKDDGRGFHLDQIKGKGRLGLLTMEERAHLVGGSFSVRSQPGIGTKVEVRVPVAQREG